jgi:hypothetical protein
LLDFRLINIDDRPWINKLLKYSDFRGCEYSFANNLAWQRLSNSLITNFKDFYVIMTCDISFMFPAGKGDYDEVLSEMKSFANSKGKPLKITNVTDETYDITEKFADKYGYYLATLDSPGWWDYVYLREDLATLKGKKYEKKRNHFNQFCKYNWEYRELTKEYFDECIAFAAVTYNKKNGFNERSSIVEQYAIDRFFEYFEEMELQGGTLWVNGLLVGFTIGEKLNSDTFCIHIEKADINYQGAFTAINHEFSKRIDCKYVNREEDMGIDGLRKSKQSKHPCFQIKKRTVIIT